MVQFDPRARFRSVPFHTRENPPVKYSGRGKILHHPRYSFHHFYPQKINHKLIPETCPQIEKAIHRKLFGQNVKSCATQGAQSRRRYFPLVLYGRTEWNLMTGNLMTGNLIPSVFDHVYIDTSSHVASSSRINFPTWSNSTAFTRRKYSFWLSVSNRIDYSYICKVLLSHSCTFDHLSGSCCCHKLVSKILAEVSYKNTKFKM